MTKKITIILMILFFCGCNNQKKITHKLKVEVLEKNEKWGVPNSFVWTPDTIYTTDFDGKIDIEINRFDTIKIYVPGWQLIDTVVTSNITKLVVFIEPVGFDTMIIEPYDWE